MQVYHHNDNPTQQSPPIHRLNNPIHALRARLHDRHHQMIIDGSGVAPEVASERGYWTATKRSELADFKKHQRQVPALVVPMFSPDETRQGVQIRPDKPRLDRKGDHVKYDTPGGARTILDVHPRNAKRVKDTDVPLWITEGIKKADALTTRGLCTIGLAGVWNWQREGELLPDWEHVALSGREIYVVFDSDVMVQEGVQLALERLTGALQARGATVRVIYLPATQDGSKVGVDDYLIAGGTVEDLHALAKPFDPDTYVTTRVSRDDRLRNILDNLWGIHDGLPTQKDAECTRRAAFRALMYGAARRGRPVEVASRGEGVRFYLSSDEGAIRGAMSQPTFSKHTRAMEAEGLLFIERPDDKAKANYYTMLIPGFAGGVPFRNNSREEKTEEEDKSAHKENSVSSVSSHHRYSQPEHFQDQVPEARWSRVIRSWRVCDGRRVCDTAPLIRLGPKRREILVYLLKSGGVTSLEDLRRRFAASEKTNLRKFKFVVLKPMIEDFPLLDIEGDLVHLRDEWCAGLENARIAGQEQDAHNQQVVVYELKRAAFHARDKTKPDRAPTEAEMKAWRERREVLAAEADGDTVELEKVQGQDGSQIAQGGAQTPSVRLEGVNNPEPHLSPLAVAVRDYLEHNPCRANESAGWIGNTLWCYELYPGKPDRVEVVAALEELGGSRFRQILLRRGGN